MLLPLVLSLAVAAPEEPLPLTGLPPAKAVPNLSSLSYRAGTTSKDCQAFFDQGLAYLYGRKWQEASAAFETAAKYDPQCPLTWWALSRALEGWGKDNHAEALKRAQELLPRADDRGRQLIMARLQEKGLLPGGRKAAAKSIDELLTLYEEDEEGWFSRALYAENDVQRVPYWKALQHFNPLHPGANFELARFHEADRGALLAKMYDDNFAKGAPGVARPTAPVSAPKPAPKADTGATMPMIGLAPSKIVPGLCVYRYRIGTTSPESQAHFDQGLGYLYSYVWMEAARSFETALRHDPECPMAWWGLSRALEKWGKSNHTQALERAQQFLHRASQRERLLIVSRLQEKGMWPGTTPDKRRPEAARTLDQMLAVFDDDEEGWYARAEVAEGGGVARVTYFKALLRLDPLHPGATHELVHFFDNYRRPALGWVYAENYIRSSPGIPHALHMQAHLGTRIGRWDKTSDYSAKAVELEKAYHKDLNVKPRDDQQYSHHLETLTRSLVHDGRFREARAAKKESQDLNYRFPLVWFRLHLGERDYGEALKIVEQYRRTDKGTASYLAALVYLQQGDTEKAATEVEAMEKAGGRAAGRGSESRLWQVQGMVKCQKGDADAGLALLAKAADKLKNDYNHHAWGEGAYYMEAWGIAALRCDKLDVAEEAFLEALAHDPGSVRGALGLQVLCERQGRTDEAGRYADLAKRCWNKADAGALEKELAALRVMTKQ
jgi:tetratricopeptide (TPR) repeat protein